MPGRAVTAAGSPGAAVAAVAELSCWVGHAMPKSVSRLKVSRTFGTALAIGAALLFAGVAGAADKAKPASTPSADTGFPARVTAVYDITWNGLSLGQFSFTSSIKGSKRASAHSPARQTMVALSELEGRRGYTNCASTGKNR